MKTLVLVTLFSLLYYGGCAQDSSFVGYEGRSTPVVTHSTLSSVQFLSDITRGLWQRLSIPYHEYYELEKRRKTQGYYNDNTLVDYVMVEISTIHNGRVFSSKSSSDKLTNQQKLLLNMADLGSYVRIKIKFKYKIASTDIDKIVEGNLAVEVIPETEAAFPGGIESRVAYFEKNVTNKLSGANDLEKMSRAKVAFTVNEEGEIQNVRLMQTTTDERIDKLLIDAYRKMPRWLPAKDAKGKKVKQTFGIPFGAGC